RPARLRLGRDQDRRRRVRRRAGRTAGRRGEGFTGVRRRRRRRPVGVIPAATLAASCTELLSGWRPADPEQERLRRGYLDHLAARPDGWARSCAGAHLTASALICSPADRSVLLVLHRKVGRWLQAGGHLEPGDPSLPAAALREATEESGLAGLTVDPEPLLLSRHRVEFCGPGGSDHLDVQFLAVADGRAD